mmetsp:Transcript_29427/g.66626  ORF Transcript_29427/g.66626 Transcript_29427/m.66626 type:complete len:133 (+) Transcript_29427:563-961(+)
MQELSGGTGAAHELSASAMEEVEEQRLKALGSTSTRPPPLPPSSSPADCVEHELQCVQRQLSSRSLARSLACSLARSSLARSLALSASSRLSLEHARLLERARTDEPDGVRRADGLYREVRRERQIAFFAAR